MPLRVLAVLMLGWLGLSPLALLQGCSQMPAVPGLGAPRAAAQPPEWMISPPPDTAEALYGVGEGLDLGTATRLALRDVASKMRVSVSGTIRSQVTESNGRVDAQASSNLMSEVQKTEFRQYTLERSAPGPQGVYALVRVDRQAFLADTRARISRMNQQTSQALAEAAKGSPLDRYLALQRARPLLQAQQGLFLMFKQADLTAADGRLQAAIQQQAIDAEAAGAKVQLQVSAPAEDADARGVLAALVAEQGVRLADRAGAAQGVLEVSAPVQLSKFGQDNVVRMQARLLLKDARGSVLAQREHLVTGASRTDAAMARQQAISRLQQELKGMGLMAALGIQPLAAP